MNIYVLLKGLAVGFSVAMPVGPIGILCIQRTLSQGRLYGIIFGLGVATADALYGSIAAFGITFISNFIFAHKMLITLVGGLTLLFLGIRIILKERYESNQTPKLIKKTNLLNDYTSALFLTLTNPITIIVFAAIFSWTWINIDITELSKISSLLLIFGIFLGSFLWFSTLSILVSLFRTKFSKQYLKTINIISGIIIIFFSFLSISSLFLKY